MDVFTDLLFREQNQELGKRWSFCSSAFGVRGTFRTLVSTPWAHVIIWETLSLIVPHVTILKNKRVWWLEIYVFYFKTSQKLQSCPSTTYSNYYWYSSYSKYILHGLKYSWYSGSPTMSNTSLTMSNCSTPLRPYPPPHRLCPTPPRPCPIVHHLTDYVQHLPDHVQLSR